jgi:hypothetical protein
VAIVDGVEAARHGAAERRRRRESRTMGSRVKDRVICWLAEKIAEQRLLWHLRRQSKATAWHADEVAPVEVDAEIRGILREDARRHGRWAIAHAAAGALSLLLVPVPGPNLLGYYFTFRMVGHYLSRAGALNGLNHVEWQFVASPALTELRQAATLEHESRRQSVAAIASRLRLEHLAAFVERLSAAP